MVPDLKMRLDINAMKKCRNNVRIQGMRDAGESRNETCIWIRALTHPKPEVSQDDGKGTR